MVMKRDTHTALAPASLRLVLGVLVVGVLHAVAL